MPNILSFTLYIIAAFCLMGCNSNDEAADIGTVATNEVYFDYKIWADEEKENVTILLQYFKNNRNGPTLQFNQPAKVQLDGEVLKSDSAGFTGWFYEVQKPLSSFAGKHAIAFTGYDGKKATEAFEFLPFQVSELPTNVKRSNLKMAFKGLKPIDKLRIIITDTSFESKDLNEVFTVNNGELNILPQQLNHVVNGPVTLDVYKEVEKEIKAGSGGTLAITYGLKREFILEN